MGGTLHAPAALTPSMRYDDHCGRGWEGPRAGLEGCRKSAPPHRCSIPGPSSPLRVAILTEPSRPTEAGSIGQLKCDGTRAETRFRLSAKRTSPFKSAGGRQFSRLLAAEVSASAVVMLDTPCSEVVWRVLAVHSIRQFPLHFPFRASPRAITL